MPNAPDLHPLRRSGEGKGTGAAGHDRVQHAAMGGYCRLSRPPNTHNLPVPASKPAKPPLPEPSEVTKTNCATGPQGERERAVFAEPQCTNLATSEEAVSVRPAQPSCGRPDARRNCSPADARPLLRTLCRWRERPKMVARSASPL